MNEEDEIIKEFLIEVATTVFLGEHNAVHTPTLEYLIEKFKLVSNYTYETQKD